MRKIIFSAVLLLMLSVDSMARVGTYGVSEANKYTHVAEGKNCSMMPVNVRKRLIGNQYVQTSDYAIVLFTSNGKYGIFKSQKDCLSFVKTTQ